MTTLYFQGVRWGTSGKAVCYYEIAAYRMYNIKNYSINDIWIIFSLNQCYFAGVDFPVDFDAFIYIFRKLLK